MLHSWFKRSAPLSVLAAALLLAACAAPAPAPAPQAPPAPPPVAEPPPPPPPPPPPEEPSLSEKAIDSGIAAYSRGEYGLAIRLLTPPSTDIALDKPLRVRALKTLAFAQCLNKAATQCRKSFEQAFQLDPDFSLAPAERGHPAWSREFERARRAARAAPAK